MAHVPCTDMVEHRLPIVCGLVPHARTATTTTTLSRGRGRVLYYYSSRATTTDHDERQIRRQQQQQQQPTRGQSTILLRGSRLGKLTNTHPYQPTSTTTSTSTSGITTKSQGYLKIEALLRFTRSSEDIIFGCLVGTCNLLNTTTIQTAQTSKSVLILQ